MVRVPTKSAKLVSCSKLEQCSSFTQPQFMNYINRLLLVCSSLILLTGCKGNIACQNPPDTLLFTLRTTDGNNIISAANADKVTIRYFRNGLATAVNDLRVQAPNYSVESLDAIVSARQTADTTRFYVFVDNKPQGNIQLKTYVDNSRWDEWTHINELRFNGIMLPTTSRYQTYALVVTP